MTQIGRAEVYASLPSSAQEPPKRLVDFSKVLLGAGKNQTITIEINPKYLSIFDPSQRRTFSIDFASLLVGWLHWIVWNLVPLLVPLCTVILCFLVRHCAMWITRKSYWIQGAYSALCNTVQGSALR
jgi:hypothetical protein